MARNILAFLLILCLGACSHSKPKPIDQTLYLNLVIDPPMLDPRQTTDLTSCIVLNMLGEGLTSYNLDNEIVLSGASDLTVSEDGKLYTFTLKETYWSNGDRVTADDYAQAWLTQLNPQFPSQFAYKLFVIQHAAEAKKGTVPLSSVGIKTLDDQTLQVELKNPTPYFLELLSTPFFFPVNHKVVKDHLDWAAAAGPLFTSNGPFQLASWIHDHEMVLTPNPFYWDKETVSLRCVHFSMVEDVQTELYLFEQGKLDLAGAPFSSLPPDSLPTLRQSPLFKEKPSLGVECLIFNTTIAPLNHPKIRQALAWTIPRNAIAEHLFSNGCSPAFSLVPPLPKLPSVALIPVDQERAAQTLFKEGLEELHLSPDQLPPLTLTYNANRRHQQLMLTIAEHWMKYFPIKVELEAADWKVFLTKLAKQDYAIARYGWAGDYCDPLSFLEPIQFMQEGDSDSLNITGWSDRPYIDLLHQAGQQRDPTLRLSLLREAESTLMNQMPLTPIYFVKHYTLIQPRCRDLITNPIGLILIKYVRISDT